MSLQGAKHKVCVNCMKFSGKDVKVSLCSICLQAGYCSRDCQKSHWKHHKKVCGLKAAQDTDAEHLAMVEPRVNAIIDALPKFINHHAVLITDVLHVPHFPLLHATRRQVQWFCLFFRSAMSTESSLGRQFVLIDGYETTPDSFLATSLSCPMGTRCPHGLHPTSGKCDWETQMLENFTTIINKAVVEDAARRNGLTEEQHRRLPAQMRLICLSNDGTLPDDDPMAKEFCATWVTTLTVPVTTDSTLDARNEGLPWLSEMKTVLQIMGRNPLASDVGTVADTFSENKKWRAHAKDTWESRAKRPEGARENVKKTRDLEQDVVPIADRPWLYAYILADYE
ncbi:hypothetical protein RQP46_010717 [Phenoliferia psychrophenolica]